MNSPFPAGPRRHRSRRFEGLFETPVLGPFPATGGIRRPFPPGFRPDTAAGSDEEVGASSEYEQGPPAPPFPPGFRSRGGQRGRRFGPGGPGGFGPGFGPGGWGPGSPGFGPGGPGLRGGHRGRGRGGRGGRRGNVRAAVLALLAEEPRHGYAIMTELAERSGGLWRPSPGSVYPVLQQLQDEGLVSVEEADGRRIFSLTDAGRDYVAKHPDEVDEPWNVADSGPMERVQSILFAVSALGAAADQVARIADDAQAERAVAAIDQARKTLYRILADDEE